MADPGFLPGFIGVGIGMAINQILYHVGIAVRCNKELESLRDLVRNIDPMVTQIHQWRMEISRRQTSTAGSHINASAINTWVRNLHALLQQALPIVQKCSSIRRRHVISRYQTSTRITSLISEIKKHLELVPLVLLHQQTQMQMEIRRESAEASSSTTATTSEGLAPITGGFLIEEPLIVGQEKAFTALEMWLIDADVKPLFRLGVLGNGGSGKSLLLKRLFSSHKVRHFFGDAFFLWLTVSQSPLFKNLRHELCSQISMQTKEQLVENTREEDAKNWLNQRMKGKRFALFLDDVWGEGGQLLEELGVALLTDLSNYKIIASSRDRTALLEMGVPENSTIALGDLVEEKSWDLFANHAFPYNNGKLPANVDEKTAKLVCAKCGGLPLAIKVVGRSMAGIIDAHKWELAVRRLPSEKKQYHEALYDRLRWSYDALGNFDVNLQLCFLYAAAAFREDKILSHREVIKYWIGEGLLARKKLQYETGHEDPFQLGIIYVNVLADRCLIEPIIRDIDGRVLRFRVHEVMRSLAIKIAEVEENFYCQAGKALKDLTQNECSGCTRILLSDNHISALPHSWRAPEICALSMVGNHLTEIPRKVIGSMVSLKVLDLSYTSLQSLPESVGCLKQLVCLILAGVPMKRLPASLTTLANLQILDLRRSAITELPSDIDRLRCLRCLNMFHCKDLQGLPCSISGLTSLQYLDMRNCSNVWVTRGKKWGGKRMASIADLSTLTQLKVLRVQNNGESNSEGTFGRMVEMETLHLQVTLMTDLPEDIFKMSKLRRFTLVCSRLVKMERKFCEFQNLIHLRLSRCHVLEELPNLHELRSLKQLDIYNCSKLKKFPKGFYETGAFPSLEIFSLTYLNELEELPVLEEGAMSALKIFTLMACESLKILPQSYLNLKTLQKIRVYGCSMVLENLDRMKIVDTPLEVITMSTTNTLEIVEKYKQGRHGESREGWSYGEFWLNQFWLFLHEIKATLS